MHGMARINPISVVPRARLMLLASASWLGVALRERVSNAATMPSTVPRSPRSGAIEPMTPRASVER